jgi:NAD(P)H-dependent FMN reductase
MPRKSACMIHTNAASANLRPAALVIMGSIRAGRRCPAIASWVMDLGQTSTNIAFELIDLNDWPLPLDDEPGIPAMGSYAQEHTRNWSQKISSADCFVFVTPQYNWGYPAALKNALDHLFKEWAGKPAMIVSYGGHGGDKCAAQLRQVAEAMKMRMISTMPALTLARDMIESGAPVDPATSFLGNQDEVRRAFGELVAELETETI